jgi:hypothetical protein
MRIKNLFAVFEYVFRFAARNVRLKKEDLPQPVKTVQGKPVAL